MKLLRYLLLPLVPVYYTITWIRNVCYDRGILASSSFDLPVICIGNLSVGGTGKTPMVEYLVRLLKDNYGVATLSRGYRRKTNGFLIADQDATAASIGDEPFQFYNKFNPEVMIAVDTDRRNGIQNLINNINPPDVIILDDAFQHRRVKAGLNILLSAYEKVYVNDWVLPTGDLREPRSGAKRADIIVITKCPDQLSNSDKAHIIKKIKPEERQEVFFSHIKYSEQVYSKFKSLELEELDNFTLVTGIADAGPLLTFLKNKGLNFDHMKFKDHHNFNENDIKLISEKRLVLTTEKDYVRLQKNKELEGMMYYLPITLNIDRKEAFDSLINSFVKT